MLYRRTPRNPPTLLLRIVASAGAGTLIGMASCGGETSTANGSIALPTTSPSNTPGDDSGPPPVVGVGGVILMCGNDPALCPPPEDASEPVGVAPCSPCGVVVGLVGGGAPDSSGSFPDASVADVEVHGVVPLPEDAGYDAHHVPIGVVIEPPDADKTTCPPLCGVVVGLSPNPGH
jgi:hypothetical protein